MCASSTTINGLLHRCTNTRCNAAHWDKAKIKKLNLKDENCIKAVLEEAEVPQPLSSTKSHFVYILRLKGEVNAVYVGMTGLHPLARYLNHIRGYKSSKVAKKRATALIKLEGPMEFEAAKIREPQLAENLRSQGYIVYGGH